MKYKKKNNENRILIISVVGLIACLLGGVCLMFGHMIELWKNAIGVLYLEEGEKAGNYIYALFETISQKNVDASEHAFIKFGYTDKGMYHMIASSNILYIAVCMVIVAIALSATMVYALRCKKKKVRGEKEQLLLKISELEDMRAQDEYLAKHNKRIQNFIENISHQIKTPISRVCSSLYLVEDKLNARDDIERIHECYRHLESVDRLMKCLMNIGRLEAGKIIFEKSKIDFKELMEEAVKSCAASDDRVDIYYEINEKVEYYGDYQWLKEGLVNIISNALEHNNSEKPLEIQCRNTSDDIRIIIRDYGKGISEKDIPNIFDRFYMPEETKATHTGIGLNLAKLIFEGHMGSIYVYNHIEGGAVFNVVLPLYALKIGKYKS